ncbi:MAG: hypothetical protein AB9M60_06350 [Leptothrix sp. (in: b-proteobacteria)]
MGLADAPRLIALIGLDDTPVPPDFVRALHAALQALHREDGLDLHLTTRWQPGWLDRSVLRAPALCLLWATEAAPSSRLPNARPADPVRQQLLRAGLAHSVLAGPTGPRLTAAIAAWQAQLRAGQAASQPTGARADSDSASRWRHVCGRCGDGDCERTLFDQARGRLT